MIRIAPQPGASPQIGKRQAHIGDGGSRAIDDVSRDRAVHKSLPPQPRRSQQQCQQSSDPMEFRSPPHERPPEKTAWSGLRVWIGLQPCTFSPAPFRTVYRKLFRRVNQALQSVKPSKIPSLVSRTIQKFLWYDVIPQQMPLVKLFAPSSSIWLREPRLSIVLPAVSALRDASNPKSPMNFGRSLIIFRQLRLTGHRRSFSVSVSLLLND